LQPTFCSFINACEYSTVIRGAFDYFLRHLAATAATN